MTTLELTVTEEGEWKRIEYDYEEPYKFTCKYSTTGRAKCRVCGELIAKNSIRLGSPVKWRGGSYGYINSWQHLVCTRVDEPNTFSAQKFVHGLGSLKPADRKKLILELKKTEPPLHLKRIDPNDPKFIREKTLPEVPQPKLLVADLLPYQKEGLGWLLNQECSVYRGGILADEMGMGKTIQALSLILASKVKGESKRIAAFGKAAVAPSVQSPNAKLVKVKKKSTSKRAQSTSSRLANKKCKVKTPPRGVSSRPRRKGLQKVNYAEDVECTEVKTKALKSEDSSTNHMQLEGDCDDFTVDESTPHCTRAVKRQLSKSSKSPKVKSSLHKHAESVHTHKPGCGVAANPFTQEELESEDYSGPTLIVCPSSAMLQWRDEILKFAAPGSLNVVVYYNRREMVRARDLQKADVVLTSYPILEYEFRTCMNKAKVSCPYCGKLYLERKLKSHLQYFCGPNSKRSAKQQLRDRSGSPKLSQATKRGMATLKIGDVDSNRLKRSKRNPPKSVDSDLEDLQSSNTKVSATGKSQNRRTSRSTQNKIPTASQKKTKRTSVKDVTPSGIYRSLMAEAGRPVMSYFASSHTSQHRFAVGDKVEALWNGGKDYYPAKVVRVYNNGSCNLEYDDGDKERRVSSDRIRPIEKAAAVLSSDDVEETSSDKTQNNFSTLGVGASIEARWNGGEVFYPGKIVKVNQDDTYNITYTDGDFESCVDKSLIKAVLEASASEKSTRQTKDGTSPLKLKNPTSVHGQKDSIATITSQNVCNTEDKVVTSSVTSVPQHNDQCTASADSICSPTRSRRPVRKCNRCHQASGALMFSSNQLLCMTCIDNAVSSRDSKPKHITKRLKLPRDASNKRHRPKVTMDGSDSSDEWLPETNSRSAMQAKQVNPSKSRKNQSKLNKGNITRKNKKRGCKSSVPSSKSTPEAVPLHAAPHDESEIGGHSSADDNEVRQWAVDDQEGVDLRASVLHRVKWTRIILDEAHKIKARTNNTAKAVYNLHSRFKWCLTGTPLQNRVGELYALIRFLKIEPFAYYYCHKKGCNCRRLHWSFDICDNDECGHPCMSHYSYFNRHIMNPIQRYGYVGEGRRAMLKLKNDVMDKIMLRRTKKERASDLKLPPLEVKTVKLTLTPEERDFYTSIYKMTRAKFDTYVTKGTLLHNYAHIFELLARLRQAVNHPYLVVHGTYRGKDVAIPTRSKGSSDVCGICQQDIIDIAECSISACHHTFHQHCIADHVEEQKYYIDQYHEKKKEEARRAKKAEQGGRKAPSKKAKSVKRKGKKTGFYTYCPVCYLPLTLTTVRGAIVKNAVKSGKTGSDLKDGKNISEEEQCVICCDRRRNALLLDCGHLFTCNTCILEMHKNTPRNKWACPICRQKIRKIVTISNQHNQSPVARKFGSALTLSKSVPSSNNNVGRKSILQKIKVEEFASSTKIEALATELKRIRDSADASSKKSIVFSQYNRMIDLCEFRLKQLGLQTVKLMGYMPMKERRSVLHAFKSRHDIDVILMSLKAGGEGLNLQEAAQVFILDPWWNPQVEAQAIQRAHRLGQKHKVVAFKFITEDSIEARMHELQHRKQLMFEGTVDGSAVALSQLTTEDLKFLFTGT